MRKGPALAVAPQHPRETGQFTQRCSRDVVPTVEALQVYAAKICDAEVARALGRLGTLSTRDVLVVRALGHRIVRSLLQRPMTVLTADAEGANMAHVLRELFQLEVAPEHNPAEPS